MTASRLSYAIVFLGLLTAGTAQAQPKTGTPRTGAVSPKPRSTGVAQRDGIVMKEGKLILTELGTTAPMTADKRLLNGTTITIAGLVTTTDGTTTQMREGDHMSLTGRVTALRTMVVADSLRKLADYDLKYPGKREKAEEERLRKLQEKKDVSAERAEKLEKERERQAKEKQKRAETRAAETAKMAAKNAAKSKNKK